jgi:peptidoglycan hydrolase CwlO-like protein
MNEIENILKDWPQAQRKLKTLTKQIEELTNTVNRNEGGD